MTSNIRLKFKKTYPLPMIQQDQVAECAHACIAMICHYHGQYTGLSNLRQQFPPSAQGCTLRQLRDIFSQLGFVTRAVRVSLMDLKHLKTPALLHWNMNHFVVLKKIRGKKAIIHDPALGVRHCDKTLLNESFTGIALEINRDAPIPNNRKTERLSIRHFSALLTKRYQHFSLLLLLSILIECMALFNPFFIQYATDQAISTHQLSNIYVVASGFGLMSLLQALTDYVRNQLIIFVTSHFKINLYAQVFKHLLSLPIAFFETRHLGDIQSKFQSIDPIQTKMTSDLVNIVLDGLLLTTTGVVMFIYSQSLTMIVLGTLTLSFLNRFVSYQSLKNKTATSTYLHTKIAGYFLETIRVITPLKLFLKENARFETWFNQYIDALNVDISIEKQHVVYRVIGQILFQTEQLIVVCLGIKMTLSNQLSIGMLMAFLAFRHQFVSKSSSFIQQCFAYRLLSVHLTRLSDIILHEPEKKYLVSTSTHHPIHGQVTLENVSFKYSSQDNMVLKNISFQIEPGEHVAIVGPSGCGKTTLLKLMMGLLTPTTGQILIDRIPMTDLHPQHLRHQMTAVMQYDCLLNGTILENITFFDEEIDINWVYEVSKIAHIHETILRFPMRYETPVGEMGSNLSGGQKQRLLLARALYKKPQILLMDEATNHLDIYHEKQINTALSTLNMTQILIAHRPETIRMAERSIDLSQFF